MTADELLRYLGFQGNYRGYKQLLFAVECVAEDEDSILNVYKCVYEVVGLRTNASAKSVEKNIRTIIKASWEKEHTRRQFEIISGYPYEEKPSTSEFLDIAADYLRKHKDAENVN